MMSTRTKSSTGVLSASCKRNRPSPLILSTTMLQFPEKPSTTEYPGLSLSAVSSSKGSSEDSSEKSPTSEHSPRITGPVSATSDSARTTAAVIHAAASLRKRGTLSHLSESDRRSEMSYRSESISIEQNRTGSKFKVVKLGDKLPYVRGRFVCFDFHDIPNKDPRVDMVMPSGGSSRVPTPDITAVVGAGGTLTAGVVVNGGGGGDSVDGGQVAQGDPMAFHNLHRTASGSVSPSPIAVVQRTGTLVQSPILPKPQPFFSPKSPVPSNQPPVFPSSNVANSPEPPRSLPVYAADGRPKDPPFGIQLPESANQNGISAAAQPDPSPKRNSDVTAPARTVSSPSIVSGRKISVGLSNSPELPRLLPVYSADGTQKEPIQKPIMERQQSEAAVLRKNLPAEPSIPHETTSSRSVTPTPPVAESAPSRKASDVAAEISRVLPMYSANGSMKEGCVENGFRKNSQISNGEGGDAASRASNSPVVVGPPALVRKISDDSAPSPDLNSAGSTTHRPMENGHGKAVLNGSSEVSSNETVPKRLNSVQEDSLALSRSAVASAAPSRKISAVGGPDSCRLLRLKGETHFAEMIDRVWESNGGNGGRSSVIAAGGFDSVRIEEKISQCMSLVTEHVLMAVRADLDQLTAKAQALRERAAALEYENYVLRTENVLLRNVMTGPAATGQVASGGNSADVASSRSRMKF